MEILSEKISKVLITNKVVSGVTLANTCFFRLYPCFLFANFLSWFSNFYAIPDYAVTTNEVLSTITMTNTWVWNNFSQPPAVTTWTVCTLMAFYLSYPVILPVLQTFSSEMLQILIILMYQIQFLPFLLIKNISPNLNTFLYSHPVFKLPVLILGISTGILTLRGVEYPCTREGYLHYIFPWKMSVEILENDSNSTSTISSETASEVTDDTILAWSQITDFCSAFICFAVLYEGIRTTSVTFLPSIEEYSQLFLCHTQLLVIVGLTKDQENSYLAKMCKTRVCQFLGKFSMAIFMVHGPIIICIIFNTSLKQEHVSTEIYGAVLSILIAVLITYILEKPLYDFVSRKSRLNILEV